MSAISALPNTLPGRTPNPLVLLDLKLPARLWPDGPGDVITAVVIVPPSRLIPWRPRAGPDAGTDYRVAAYLEIEGIAEQGLILVDSTGWLLRPIKFDGHWVDARRLLPAAARRRVGEDVHELAKPVLAKLNGAAQ